MPLLGGCLPVPAKLIVFEHEHDVLARRLEIHTLNYRCHSMRCLLLLLLIVGFARANTFAGSSVVEGNAAFQNVGQDVTCACDFNGDGSKDCAVSGNSATTSILGRVYIFLGYAGRLPTLPDRISVATANVTVVAQSALDLFGGRLACGKIAGETALLVSNLGPESSVVVLFNLTRSVSNITLLAEAANSNFGFSSASSEDQV